ncbi:quinone oxidoreductase family protein [Roseixanthobacter liquoris]|uniref:quinone oxidoreductase family protein n=1 Tax=Roseixanthobacter liquoris TaxID=3119921 RepID=UPI00372CD948
MSATYRKIIVDEIGPPEVMRLVEETAAAPGAGEVFIRQEAIGVDYIDTQMRSGIMPATLPTGLGFGAVGTVEAVGPGVTHVKAGDRVAYVYAVAGSYAEARTVPAERVVRLPDQAIPAEAAAGALFRGVTAWYLSTRLREIKPGDFVLVHAAAGGVGLILIQWLKHLGAIVIGTVETPEKIAVLREYGCDHAILLTEEDFVARVKEITGGKGVSVVYESIGKETFDRSLECAARFGLIVSFGWPSGDVEPISLANLRNKGSLFVTRPTVSHYTADAGDFRTGAGALFDLIAKGAIRIKVGNSYPLADAPKAHADLVAQRTLGSVVLTV